MPGHKIVTPLCSMAYQIGTIGSLLTGVYEGDLSFGDLRRYGDFGLGTFDAVNGEMVALDGHYFRIDASGNARPVMPDMKTPFAVVTFFQGGKKETIHDIKDLSSLQERIQASFESDNIIYALRVDGCFTSVDVRSEHPQPAGHIPLDRTLAQVQTRFAFHEIVGTLVGFWFPEYMQAINVPGFHFHFLDAAHQRGGHLFNVQLRRASLQVMGLFDFGMHLIHTPLFEHVNLNSTPQSSVHDVEEG